MILFFANKKMIMKYLLTILFSLFAILIYSQELKFVKATMQTVNHGASPTSTTTYFMLLEKNKKFKWSVDSVVSIATGEKINYNIVKVDNPESTSPKYEQVKSFNKCDLGKYQLTFSITKNKGSGGRPGSPQNQKADTTNIEGGIIIYYTSKGKTQKIKIVEFEKLDTINAP